MDISRQDRVRMERAHVLAWPALRSAKVEGWLWRSSGGGSRRANSVSTIDFASNDVKKAVAEVEARYRAVGAPAQFHTFDETSPSGLVEHLQDSGYRQAEPTVTMFKRLGKAAAVANVEIKDHAWDLWRQVYLAEITQDRRAVNAEILERIPAPRAFSVIYKKSKSFQPRYVGSVSAALWLSVSRHGRKHAARVLPVSCCQPWNTGPRGNKPT